MVHFLWQYVVAVSQFIQLLPQLSAVPLKHGEITLKQGLHFIGATAASQSFAPVVLPLFLSGTTVMLGTVLSGQSCVRAWELHLWVRSLWNLGRVAEVSCPSPVLQGIRKLFSWLSF